MKNKNIILYLLGLILFASCQDMYTPADENTRQEDAMKLESEYANGLIMYGYSSLPYLTSTQTDIATDDAVTNQTSTALHNLATGTWAADANPSPINQWDGCLGGIQYVNKFLSLVEEVKMTPSSKAKQKMLVDRLKGEAFTIRAILYLSLLQAHGGYGDDGVLYGAPLFTKPLDASSNFNMARSTFAKCMEQIFFDCDSAMILLPKDYKNISSTAEIPSKYNNKEEDIEAEVSGYNSVFGAIQTNRISGRIAQAVKAQAALVAASPAFREQSGVTSAQAAKLCSDVLRDNDSKKLLALFDPTGHLDWYYKNNFSETASEILWRIDNPNQDNNQEKEQFPPSLYGNGRVNPSQNFVDAFPMNNGLPISDPNSGYDPQNPYANRDMRLSNTVIYNGMKFRSANILTGANMGYGKDEFDDNIEFGPRSTRTGYYLKKLLREDASANPSSPSKQMHIYPRIRYTEIFLAYAEAANDAYGPTTAPDSVGGVSAYEVIKAIRERAGIGKDEFGRPLAGGDLYLEQIKGDQAKMTELIRNERRLELCFENKRFWDLRRWMMPLSGVIQGMKVEKIDPEDPDSKLKYSVFRVEDRVFDDSYQWYGPIPKGEVLKWSNLKQNKGWK
mgnify:CR=1 FL=1